MKHLSIFLIISFLACLCFSQRTVIRGKIKNPQVDSVEFISFAPFEYGNLPSVKLNKKQEFCFIFELKSASTWRLKHGGESVDLFVMPKDSVFLTFDGKEIDMTLTASGIHAEHYNYWREKLLAIPPFCRVPSAPEQEAAILDSFATVKRHFLQKYIAKYPNVLPIFSEYLLLQIRYGSLDSRIFLPQMYAMNHNIATEEVPVPKGYYDFLDTATINEPRFWVSNEYQSFEKRLLQEKCNQLKKRSPNRKVYATYPEMYQFGKIFLTDSTKWFILADILKTGIYIQMNKELEEVYEDFQKNCPFEYPKQVLARNWKEMQKLQKGEAAPDFVAIDLKGNKVSLADFRGKVVYLDIWTTTCGPCLWYMKHEKGKALKEKFADKKVVFLNVCLDESEEIWKDRIKVSDLEGAGVHLFQAEKGDIRKNYAIYGYPSYFIIDAKGNIFDALPPRPNHAELMEELEKALQIQTF